MNTVSFVITAALALVFTLALSGQYIVGRKPHQLVWAVFLGLVGTASFLQWLWLAGSTHEMIFRVWYLVAVVLVVSSLAIGMAVLILPNGLRYGVIGVLLVMVVVAAVLDLVTPLEAEVNVLEGSLLTAKQPTNGESFYPEYVQGLTFFLSLFAGLVLIGSAAYLGVLVILKRLEFRRAIPIILVGVGALMAQEVGMVSPIGFGIVLIGLLSYQIPLRRRTTAT